MKLPERITITYLREEYKKGTLTPKAVIENIIEKAAELERFNIWICPPTMEKTGIAEKQKLPNRAADENKNNINNKNNISVITEKSIIFMIWSEIDPIFVKAKIGIIARQFTITLTYGEPALFFFAKNFGMKSPSDNPSKI